MSEDLQLGGKIMKLIYDQALKSISVNEVKALFSFLIKKNVINSVNIQLSENLIKDLIKKANKHEFDSEWELFESLEELERKH